MSKPKSNMKKLIIVVLLFYLLLFACFASASKAETAQIGVPISKPTIFSFEEEIIDIDLGNQNYHVKLRGKSLLIFAKKQRR